VHVHGPRTAAHITIHASRPSGTGVHVTSRSLKEILKALLPRRKAES
jgi:hypothetical protein